MAATGREHVARLARKRMLRLLAGFIVALAFAPR